MTSSLPGPVEEQSPSATLTPSLVRTLLPFLAGLIGTWLLEQFGVAVDTATIGALLTAAIGYGYYVVVRFLEVYGSDKWGYILGFRKLPVYATPPLPATVVASPTDPPSPSRDLGAASLAGVGTAVAVLALVVLVVAAVFELTTLLWIAVVVVVLGIVAGFAGSLTPRR